MDERIISKIDTLTSNMARANDNLILKHIQKSDFDKTLIGFVSEKVERNDGKYCWRIQTNGVAYDIKPEMCNIQAVGQRVRLYIPNHSFKDKYAEVIDDGGYNHPAKVVFDDDTNTITETYNLIDGTVETRSFTLNIENEGLSNEEVTAITFPDGSVMTLEGFIIG